MKEPPEHRILLVDDEVIITTQLEEFLTGLKKSDTQKESSEIDSIVQYLFPPAISP